MNTYFNFQLAEALIEKEVINHDDLVELIGEPPHGDKRKMFYQLSLKDRKEKEEETIFGI